MNNLKDVTEDRVALIKKRCGNAANSARDSFIEKCSSFQVCSSSGGDNEGGILLFLAKVVRMALSYIDLVKDLTLTVQLIILIGLQALFSSYFTLFQSTIVWLMIFSVGAPLLMSAIQTTIHHPTTLLDFNTWRNLTSDPKSGLTWVRVCMFCTYLFVPSIQTNNKEGVFQRRKELLEKTEEQ